MTSALNGVLALLASVALIAVKPDFSESTITAESPTIAEGDVVTFTMLLRNSGDQPAPGTELELELPFEAMFVDLAGLEHPTIDPHAKLVTASVDLPAGGEHRVSFRLVVPRDSGGSTLNPSFRLRNLYLATEHSSGARIDVDTRVPTSGIRIGGIRIGPPELALLALLALYPTLLFFARRRGGHANRRRSESPHAPVLALVIAVGFWTIFAAMAWRDWRTINAWRQTSCTIVDSRLRAETTSSIEPGRRGRIRPTTSYSALLALKYSVDGQEVVSTGFDTDSRLGIGGAQRAYEDVSRWPIGTVVPCWFDPDDVGDVVVIPGFGGAYFFALLPLPLFIYGFMAIRRGGHYNS